MIIAKRHFCLTMAKRYTPVLDSFISSPHTFQITNTTSTPPNHTTLHILDSSFNPPTKAHLNLAEWSRPRTVLLLLAIQNADKPPKPVSFDHRLAMMNLLAQEIEHHGGTSVLIALSKHARFVDKARDVLLSFPEMQKVVWLVGYDTLIRVLDQKYYPGTLEDSLRGFWERNRLVCAIRGDDVTERGYVDRIRRGEVIGVPPAWAEYITVIEPVGKEVSSTNAREAAHSADWATLQRIVPAMIAEYIRQEKLYVA
jgi:nicotinamide-nucleotide adenylyltransferase